MAVTFNPFTGNLDFVGAGAAVPDPLTVDNLTVNTLLTAAHIHGSLAGSVYIHVKNLDVAPLEKGTPFYVSGTVGSSDRVEIKRADADGSGTGPAIGLVESTLTVNGEGNGVIIGEIYNYDTATPGWATNDALYVSTTGTLTNVRPTTGYRQIVGHVGRVHASTGTIVVAVGKKEPVAGSNTQIQFNDDGGFGGSADLTFDKTTKQLTNKGDISLDDGGTYTTTLQCVTPTANRTISLPDATGTIGLVGGSGGNLVWNNAGAYAGVANSTVDSSGNITIGARLISSTAGAASLPPITATGTWFTGGTATTTKPQVLIEPTGTTSTAWSTSGTGLGVNAASGFTGNLLDLQVNGTSRFVVNSSFIARQNPDSTATGGNARGAGAVDFSSSRTNAINVASGADSFLAATTNGRATGSKSVCFHDSICSGTSSFAAAGGEASGNNSLAFGPIAKASSTTSVAIGDGVIASGQEATALGRSATASGIRSFALNWGATTPNLGQFGYGFRDHGAQWTVMGLVNQTTGSTAVELLIEGASGNGRAVLPANTTWAGTAMIAARTRNGISNATFQRQVMIKRDGSNNTELVGTVQTLGADIKSNADFDATVTITADNTNESLKVEGTAKVGGTVSSITSSGTTCTVTMSANHGLLTGDYVTIAGAAETQYNGTFTITKTGDTTFTYTAATTPSASPATGTITANITCRWVCKLDLVQITHSA